MMIAGPTEVTTEVRCPVMVMDTSPTNRPRSSAKILVVDDDRAFVQLVTLMLHQVGYTVVAATDLDVAIQKLIRDDPDLLLLDVHLGGRHGFEIAEHMHQLGPSFQRPIIFFTGDNSNWTSTISAALGARGLMRKPLLRDELLLNIQSILI